MRAENGTLQVFQYYKNSHERSSTRLFFFPEESRLSASPPSLDVKVTKGAGARRDGALWFFLRLLVRDMIEP